MGVAGRMKFLIIKRKALKEICGKYIFISIFKLDVNFQIVSNLDIPKPVLTEGNQLKFDPKQVLIPQVDFEKLQKENYDTKKYYWYNHFDEVTLNNAQTGKKEKVLWKGQR